MEKKNKKVLFKIENLKKYFPVKKEHMFELQRYVHANEDISLNIYEGETLGLVGESGSGKSTLGRTIIQLHNQTEGNTLYYGRTVSAFAPNYVEKLIGKIDKLYPEYLKAVEELRKLESEKKNLEKEETLNIKQELSFTKDEVASMEEDKIEDSKEVELEDKLIQARKNIENNYLNMLRLAGGLLTYKDLKEVSKVLKEQNDVRKKRSKIIMDLEDLELKITDSEYANKKASLENRKKELEKAYEKLSNDLLEKDKLVEDLRLKCVDNDHFEELEEKRDDGIDLSQLDTKEMRRLRKELQIIFQDPYSSLDTKLTVGNIVGEGVLAHDMFKSSKSKGYNEYVSNVMDQCGLESYFIYRYPHQFSGGQRQRIGIARALAVQPKFIVCDEAVSALDVSIQSSVINLLQKLKEENGLTYLFITHDLSVVKYISDRIAVMYLGEIVELAESEIMFASPKHPYTQALLMAIPRTDVESNQELTILEGDIPSAVNPPSGCKFHTRCKYAMPRCKSYNPQLIERDGKEHFVACHLYDLSEEERKEFMEKRDIEEAERQRK